MEEILSIRLVTAFSVLTVLTLSAGSSVYSCPIVCTCYVDEHGFRTANCTDVKFLSEHKFNKVIREIEVLNVEADSDDHLILWDDMFSPFTKLKILNLSKCKINYLPKNVFKGLKKIYEINLSYNDLRHFDNSVFENTYTLYKLNLRGNPLQATYKPFISSPSLRDLDLGYCSMTVLQNEFFHGVKKVSRLHLDGNHLQTIKEHVLPRGIIHLNLASNRIVNVPISAIFSLNQLRWINLSANPINCTCPLLNLQDRLSGRGIIVEGDVRCAYPLELESVSWSKINENELCNKEMFRSRLHTKKSHNAKYIYGHRRDNYFENEKYSSLESFQGDDPRKSGDDDDYDNLMSEEGYAESNSGIPTENESNRHKQHTNSKIHEIDVKKETEDVKKDNHIIEKTSSPTETIEADPQITSETGALDDNLSEKHISSTEKHNHEKLSKALADENTDYTALEKTNIAPNADDGKDQVMADGAAEDEEDSTAPPMTTDADIVIGDPEINAKSSLDNLDEGLKREDEILPVAESPHNEPTEADNIKNIVDEKSNANLGNIIDEDMNKKDQDSGVPEVENENDANKSDIEATKKTEDIEPPMIIKNVSEYHSVNTNDLEGSINLKDHQNLKAEPTNPSETDNKKENNLLNQNEINLSNEKSEGSLVLSSTTEVPVISSTDKPVIPNESEGSGDDSINILDESSSVSIVDETAKEVTPEPTDIPSSKIPIIFNPGIPGDVDGSGDIDNESSRLQVIDKSDTTYEAMGPYIVVLGIIILITILIFVSIYKGLCKSNKNNGKPVPDVEASNGTELQDMKSLLPKTPVNDEKHNNKYPNEVPSPETVNLIKDDKPNDTHEPNGVHDLNQNDSKNEPVVKNGKSAEGSPPPIEVTKAKLTVLLESIPRTPIFVQKRSTTINNG